MAVTGGRVGGAETVAGGRVGGAVIIDGAIVGGVVGGVVMSPPCEIFITIFLWYSDT